MNEDSSPSAPRKSGVGRKLGLGLAVLLVLLIVLYFVVSSGAFLKGFILPRVAKSMNMEMTVADASLSPFSQVTLEKVKVQPAGGEPLLTADQVRVRYSLMSILRGHYVVDELTLTSPIIQIINQANGSSNLDPLTKGSGSKPSSSKSEEPLQLAVRQVTIKDGVVRMVDKAKDGSVTTTELDHANLSVDRLENGQPGKLVLATDLRREQRLAPGVTGTNDLIEGKIDGTFDFKLDQKLLPQSVSGKGKLAMPRAAGAYAELAGLNAELQADMTPTEVRQLALGFERSGRSLGRLQASGPLDLAKKEGRLKLEIQSIDRQVLNLFGAGHGWDFADSKLNSTNVIEIAQQGEVIGAEGDLAGRQMSIKQQGKAPPPLDLDLAYKITVNRNEKTALIARLNLSGRQQQTNVLVASLDKPMTLTWAPNARGFNDSTFKLALTNVVLNDWQAVLGTNLPSGRLSAGLVVTNKQDGKELITKATLLLQDGAAQLGTNRLEHAQINLAVDGKLDNFKTLDLREYTLSVQQLQQPLLSANGSAHYDLSTSNLTLQANAELALPAWLRLFPNPDFAASTGSVKFSSAVLQKDRKYSVTGNLFLADFTGRYGSYNFQDYQTALDYDVTYEKPALQIRSASLTVRKGYTAGGSATLSGDCDLDKSSARLSFKLLDLNQNAIGPFLSSALGDKKLVSISLTGSGSTQYDPKGETALKADLSVTNWVVSAPQQQFVSPVLGAQLQLDGGAHQEIVELRQCLLKLSPTKNAKNELLVKGRLDMGKTNASPSQLTVQAESLDFTPYYEMFAGNNATNSPAAARAPARAAAPAADAQAVKQVEPAPMVLPFQQFNADVKIDRLYLREIAVTNLQTTIKIKGGEVTMRPFDLTINGAPVTADAGLNLGVPGYIYDVSFKTERLPMDPLSVSLTTNAPGTFIGNLYAQAQIKGAGVTGPNLRKNLSGNLSLNLTNMNYEIVGRKIKRVLEPIALALRVPELAQTPLNWISAKAEMGKGQIDLQQFVVQSQAFLANAKGPVPIADVLTNSPLNLPVALSLRRTFAEKAGLVPASSATNEVYASLPTFVTLTGTLGEPKTDINKLVVGGLLAKSLAGIAPIGNNAGNLLQGIGGLLAGQSAAPAGTNAPAATNATPTANIVQGLSGLLGAKKAAPSTNAPAAATNKTAKPSGLDFRNLTPQRK